MTNLRELMVGRRGESPLVPPYILCNFKRDGAVSYARRRLQSAGNFAKLATVRKKPLAEEMFDG